MWSAETITWITFALVGQFSMLLLLGTFLFVKSLPQRKNPFLINFLLTTFLATIPPCLLFYTGHQDGVPPHWLCLVQAVLMDGVAPMFGVALVVLVIHTWGDLRAILWGKKVFTTQSVVVKWLLLSVPYIVLISWCAASLVAALQQSADLQLLAFVYCSNNSHQGSSVRQHVGYIMIMCGIIELSFEVLLGSILLTPFKYYRSHPSAKSSSSYHANVQISIRILIFSALQLTPVILSLLNSKLMGWNSFGLKQATQIVESMDAFATFLVFGTQKDVLRAWKFWDSTTVSDFVVHHDTQYESGAIV